MSRPRGRSKGKLRRIIQKQVDISPGKNGKRRSSLAHKSIHHIPSEQMGEEQYNL